jgi:hypothetical protein
VAFSSLAKEISSTEEIFSSTLEEVTAVQEQKAFATLVENSVTLCEIVGHDSRCQ